MALPANIRVNVRVPFPAQVSGSGMVVLTKANGIWAVSIDFTKLSALNTQADIPGALVAVYDPVTKLYNTLTVSQVQGVLAQRSIRTNADLPIRSTDVILNLGISAPLAVSIPVASTRVGLPLRFQDVTGSWAAGTSVTFSRSGTDQFDGANTVVASLKYGWIEFTPLNDGINSGYKIRGIYQ